MKKWILAGSICTVFFASCDKNNDNNNANSTDQNFVMMASLSNNAEVGAGQLAASKGNSAMVKMFGQHMVDEHVPAQADLKNRALGISIAAPDTIDAEHKALMARLNSLSGYSFDTAYINSQIKDHAKTLDVFNTEINGGNNQSIKSFATDNIGHIQEHYNKADSIRRNL